MRKNSTARKTYKRTPAVQIRNNVIQFPGSAPSITTSPTMEDLVNRFTYNDSVDITELILSCGTEASQLCGDVLEYIDRSGNVIWSVVRGEVLEVA